MTIDTKELVTTMAYLIGVPDDKIETAYGEISEEQLNMLKNDKAANIIRYINRLKTNLMKNFKYTDMEIKNNLKNLDRLDYFDQNEIKALQDYGIQIIIANHKASEYINDFTRLLSEHIGDCKHLFREWINFDYIKELFAIPSSALKKGDFFKKEFEKYMSNKYLYPYQMYIYWDPVDEGNILYNDAKFLEILYRQHNEEFTDKSRVKDAHESVKKNIYDFIRESDKISIVVDCENSDVFKLYSVLKNLDADELSKINSIKLYDDIHTTYAWNLLHKFIHIPAEHIEVERVTDRKSLVDIKIATGVCKDYYENGVTSVVLVSSDSDYWGLISSMPEMNFLVMYEYDKCGYEIKNALAEKGIYYCSIDDFCKGNTEDFKKQILLDALKAHFPNLLNLNGKELAKQIYEDAQIPATDKEINVFYNRYIKTLRLKCDTDGNFSIQIDTY